MNTLPAPDPHASSDKPQASLRPTWFWQVMHLVCFLYFVPMYRFRAWGVRHVPLTGPVLLVSNHQSFFDPILVGLPLARRRFYAMARKTLWDHPAVGWLIEQLSAVPVDQENAAGDLRAMRQCVEILRQGQMLLVFPEGSRTLTGETDAFLTGTMLLIKRARPAVVPVALDGAFDAWPRGRKLPRPTGRMGVRFGEPIPAEALLTIPPGQALTLLRDRVESLRLGVAKAL